MKQKFSISSFFLLVVLVFAFVGAGCGSSIVPNEDDGPTTGEQITLEYWRVFENSDVLDQVIERYNESKPNVEIVVKKKDAATYEQDLLNALAAGTGPDIWMIHNDWLPKHQDKIQTIPSNIVALDAYEEAFPQVVSDDFVLDGEVYALPYSLDTLMLFYNEDIFDDNRVRRPPETWDQVIELARSLTKFDNRGNIIQSGITLGTAETISRAPEILAALMMQNGAKMVSDDKTKATFDLPIKRTDGSFFDPAANALSFYAGFANRDFVDSSNQSYVSFDDKLTTVPVALQAFHEGKAAMFLGYSYQIDTIQRLNPDLDFKTAPLPQIKNNERVDFANYWGETVSADSENARAAWEFIAFASRNVDRILRNTGKAPAKLELLEKTSESKLTYPVAVSAVTAKSWYRNDVENSEEVFREMINAVLHDNVDPKTAVRRAAEQITDILQADD